MLDVLRWIDFEDGVVDRTRDATKIQRSAYLPVGSIPVIDQGHNAIAGYTNEPGSKYGGALPVVLFGDHTRALKFVDFPFAAGADGIKVLEPCAHLNARFLWYFLRAQRLPNDGYSRHFKHLRALKIPVPSMERQLRVADLLGRAESIFQMRKEAEHKAKGIIPALFLDMFGDPATNPKGWELRQVGDAIRSAEYGTSTKASDDKTGIPVIRMGNVDATGRLSVEDLKYVVLPEAQRRVYALEPGDILFNRTNSKELVGKTGIWRGPERAVAASYFIRVRVDEETVLPDYFWVFMNTRHMKSVLYSTARGAIGQSNINAKELRALRIPFPPTSLQKTFARRIAEALELEEWQGRASGMARTAFQSLLAGVFGEVE